MSRTSSPSVGASLAFLAGTRLAVNTAHRFIYPFLPAISRGLGVSLDTAGLLVSARWGAGLATPALVSAFGRGEQRRRLIGFGLGLFALGAAVTAATSVFVGAVVGFVLMGLGKPVYDISAMAYLADRTPYQKRARYLAVLELTWAAGFLIGAPFAGWLISRAGWRTPFWVIAILVAIAFWLRFALLEPDVRKGDVTAAEPLGLDRSAIVLLAVIALFNMASEVVFVVFGAWLELEFDLSLVALGGTAVLIGIAELSSESATVAFTDRIGKRRAVGLGMLVAIAGWFALAAAAGSQGWGLLALLIGVAGFEFTVVSSIPLATEVRPAGRARYLSWMIVATSLGRAAGAAMGTPLFTSVGIELNAVVAAVANVIGVILLVAWVRERSPERPVDMILPE